MNAPCTTYEDWKQEVDQLFISHYGASWADLCGDDEPLRNAYEGNESPSDFVEWWADKYNLDPVDGPFRRLDPEDRQMIATKRRKIARRCNPTNRAQGSTPIRSPVGLKAFLVTVEGMDTTAIFAVACNPSQNPIETVKAVHGLGDDRDLEFEVIPAEGICVHVAGDVPNAAPAEGTRS